MPTTPHGVLSLYAAALASMLAAVELRTEPDGAVRPLERGAARGQVEPGVPRLDPEDPMANRAVLQHEVDDVGYPGLDDEMCRRAPRTFSVLLGGHVSYVRFGTRAVCQLARLKQISSAQPGFGVRGLGELAAFVIGRRSGPHVDVTRLVVPPFRFTGEDVTFVDADLGPLKPGELFVGTYHTHPEGDAEQGVLSPTDLAFMLRGRADFHGHVGWLAFADEGVEWLFDIVEPRDGDWNVFAHERGRLTELAGVCNAHNDCPVDELRLAGSRFYLLVRYHEGDQLF